MEKKKLSTIYGVMRKPIPIRYTITEADLEQLLKTDDAYRIWIKTLIDKIAKTVYNANS